MQSLFPQGNAQPTQAPLVQFRAGKCTMSSVQPNGKFLVTPDPRSGRVSLSKGSDGLLHFKWTNALTNTVEDDRIVFPGEYTFKKVKTGRNEPTDRVFMLRYSTGQQRLMFWMQEKEADKDEEVVKKVNDFLLNPNAVVVANAAPAAGAGQQAGGVVSPDEWMRLIGLDPSAALAAGGAAPARSSSAPLGPPLAPEAGLGNLDLSQILRTLAQQGAAGSNVPPPAPPAATAPSGTAPAAESGAADQQGEEEGASGGQNGSNSSNNEDEDESGGNMEQ